jgi:hypothetical protein
MEKKLTPLADTVSLIRDDSDGNTQLSTDDSRNNDEHHHYTNSGTYLLSDIEISTSAATFSPASNAPSWISFKALRRLAGGVLCVIIVVALWIIQAQVLGNVQKGSNYHKVFFHVLV